MYPDGERLREVGKVAIASARLDGQLAALLCQLDRTAEFAVVRRWSTGQLIKALRKQAEVVLRGELRQVVLDKAQNANGAADERHRLLHGEWLITSNAAMVPVSEVLGATDAELQALVDRSVPSTEWQQHHPRDDVLAEAPTLLELQQLRRALELASQQVLSLCFAVASSREAGTPPGWNA